MILNCVCVCLCMCMYERDIGGIFNHISAYSLLLSPLYSLSRRVQVLLHYEENT